MKIEIFTTLFYRELQKKKKNSRACENPVKAIVEVQQYNKNVAEQKSNKHNSEIICTRISHPRELLYDSLQINDHEMTIFFACVSFTVIRNQSLSLGKMNKRTKIVKQIEICRRILKLTM